MTVPLLEESSGNAVLLVEQNAIERVKWVLSEIHHSLSHTQNLCSSQMSNLRFRETQ